MSPLNINAFKIASTQGYAVKIDEKGKLKSSGNKFLGRVVSWLKWKANIGTFREDNQKVMYAFVNALKEKYGDSFGNMIENRLNPQRGKPLTSRQIKSIIEAGEKHKALIRGMKEHLKFMFSEADIHGEPNCFGSVFAEVQDEFGVNFSLDNMATNRLKLTIRQKINWASMNDKKPVSIKEAKEIATKEIRNFLDTKVKLLEKINQLAKNKKENNVLTDIIIKNEGVKSSEYLDLVWQSKDNAVTFIKSVSDNPTPQNLLANLGKLLRETTSLTDKYLNKLHAQGKEAGADEITLFNSNMFEIAIKTGGFDNATLNKIYNTLTSRENIEVLEYLYAIHDTIASSNANDGDLARSLEDLFKALQNVVGENLGFSREDIESARELHLTINNVKQLPKNICKTLQDLGFESVYDPEDPVSILKSPVGRTKFIEFTEKDYSDENPKFWLALQEYKSASSKERAKIAKEIVDTFIKPGSEKELNLSSETRKSLLENYEKSKENPPEDLFDQVEGYIKYLMKHDIVQRFIKQL